jgi:SAM-dependent methyltransferase
MMLDEKRIDQSKNATPTLGGGGRISLPQRGRAGMQFLGALQHYTGGELRAIARAEFEADPDGKAIIARKDEDAGRTWRERIAERRAVAERHFSYQMERLYQRYVAEEIYIRGIPAIEQRRAQAEAFMTLPPGPRLGSLELDPDLEMPTYYKGVEWHLMPGGWDSYDIMSPMMASGTAPLVFKRGGWAAVEVGDDNFQQRLDVARQFRTKFRNIYEPGSGGSHTLCMIHRVHPDAGLHGSDLSAYLLTAGHISAERLGIPVHLKQRDSRNTREPGDHYEAVITYALQHEMTVQCGIDTFREMYRIMKPGGEIVVCDVPPFHAVSPFQSVILDWDTKNRGEPFFSSTREIEWADVMRDIGFVDVEAYSIGKAGYPYIQRARKPPAS